MPDRFHKLTCLALAASVLGLSGFGLLFVQMTTWHTLFVKYIQIMDIEDAVAFAFTSDAGCGYEHFADGQETNSGTDLHLVELKDVRLLQLGLKTASLSKPAALQQRLMPTPLLEQPSFVQHPEPPPPKGGLRSDA